jgi:hypothetical protein
VDERLGILRITIKSLISIFFTILLLGFAGDSYAQVPQIERDALVSLYNSTDGANWTDNTGWLGEAGTECSWFGVTCTNGSVSRLYFWKNGLNGTIPSELGNLSNLTWLNLGNNSLSGTIPSELGNLTKLTQMMLFSNSLTGGIPAELGNLANLTTLQLSFNSLSGSIPSELGNLTDLTYLNLSYNSLTGTIPSEVSSLPKLTTTNYDGNLFIGPGFSISSVERDALVALYNSTDGANWTDNTGWLGEAGTECSWFGVTCTNGSVSRLSLHTNLLTGTIPIELGNLSNLTILLLGDNSLTGSIPSELGNLTNLTTFNLASNSLTGTIPKELGNLTELTSLVLQHNPLTGTIPKELGNLTKLTVLWLFGHTPTGGIPSELGNLTNLKQLQLGLGEFWDSYYEGPIPSSLKNLPFLKESNIGKLPVLMGDSDNDGIADRNDEKPTVKAEYKEIVTSDYSLIFSPSSRVVNYVTDKETFEKWRPPNGDFYPNRDKNLTNIIYEHFDDEFDFIMAAPNISAHRNAYNAYIKLPAAGLGKGSISDSTEQYGSKGRLHTFIYFNNPNYIKNGPSLHEIMHAWGAPTMFKSKNKGHWGGSNVGGILGGWKPNSLKKLADGTYQVETTYKGFNPTEGWADNVVPYSNFELYLMGMIGPDEVGQDLIQANDYVLNGNGTFSASSLTTTTMDQFIEENGARIPNHLESQKEFEALYVVVSEKPLTLEEWNLYDDNVSSFQAQEDDGYKFNYNFWEATQGKASISFGQIDHLKASSLALATTAASPLKSIPSVAISGSSRTISDTDDVAGESVSFIATATDGDGTIATTQWLVDGVEVATSLRAILSLPNGSTVVTFKATDDDGKSSTATATITVEAPNVSPAVTISGGTRTIVDTDSAAGESVSFTATATDSDGTIATTQWLVDGVEVATGLSATLSLPNGLTVVTFKATDDDGTSSTTTATITVASPAYEPTEEWPSPYNGVTPDSSYGLEFNNVGVLNSSDATIYVCLRIFTEGLPSAVNGVSQFDMGLKVASLSDATVQITKYREFNTRGALNEKAQTPDCSGKFETTTGVYTDIIQTETSALETTWNLIDPTNLILKLDSFKELTAN